MELTSRNIAAKWAANLFGFVALIGVFIFEYWVKGISTFGVEILVPYSTFVLIMAFLAIRFSHWYLPETGLFEAVVIPVLLPIVAAAISGIAYSVSAFAFRGDRSVLAILASPEVYVLGIYAGVVFLYVSGIGIFFTAAVASVILRTKFSQGAANGAV